MKKNGFTLAEVLVTLGIIGVVAALAMPALNSAVQKTKVGPSLRKFMYALENADRMVMQEKDVDDLSVAVTSKNNYVEEINKNIAGGSYSTSNTAVAVNGAAAVNKTYVYTLASGEQFFVETSYPAGYTNYTGSAYAEVQPDTNYSGKLYWVFYDMNGFDSSTGKPNKFGKDQFVFYVDKNGTVLPLGSKAVNNAYCQSVTDGVATNPEPVATGDCADTTGEKTCQSPLAAGAIANNSWKVGYKY